MFSLQDFFKYIRLKNRISHISFFLAFILDVIFLVIFNLASYKIAWIVGVIIFYIALIPVFEKLFAHKYFKDKKNIISYIFFREYFGDRKYNIHENFSKKEIEDFIENLDCEAFISENNIPSEYSFVKNESYSILEFKNVHLKHYTRIIPWEIVSWKYSFRDNEGIEEFLEIEYVNESNETIKEEIFSDRIKQKTSFHLFLLFVIHDLKYGKRLSLQRDYYMKKRSFFKVAVFE